MEVNGGWIAVAGIALPFFGTIIVANLTQRSAARNTSIQAKAEDNRANEAARAASGGTWDQQFSLQQYIDSRIEDAVKKSNEERDRRIDALEAALRGSLAQLVLIKNWARDYIRSVLDGWGINPQPPKVDSHIIDLITEDDLNGTLTGVQIQQLRNGKNS